jgi:hypothetical protein
MAGAGFDDPAEVAKLPERHGVHRQPAVVGGKIAHRPWSNLVAVSRDKQSPVLTTTRA